MYYPVRTASANEDEQRVCAYESRHVGNLSPFLLLVVWGAVLSLAKSQTTTIYNLKCGEEEFTIRRPKRGREEECLH